MSVARKRTRRHLSITSLIDVIFLLLLFFMLASTFTKLSELEIGHAGQVGFAASSDVKPMRLVIGAQDITMEGLSVEESALIDTIKRGMGRSDHLVVQFGGEVAAQRLTDILVLIEPVDGLQVAMVTAP